MGARPGRIATHAGALLAFALVAGCGAESDAPPSAPPPTPTSVGLPDLRTSVALERIKQRGKVIVGVHQAPPAYFHRDPKTGEQSGFDVEIARVIARGLGLKSERNVIVKPLPAPIGNQAVTAGDIDFQLGVTKAEAAGTTLVGPYLTTSENGGGAEQFIAITGNDRILRDELARILRTAVSDGSWQRAYEQTLQPVGIEAKPPVVN